MPYKGDFSIKKCGKEIILSEKRRSGRPRTSTCSRRVALAPVVSREVPVWSVDAMVSRETPF